jgi:hypothetical protein
LSWRSPKLLRAARDRQCQRCGARDGVSAAHANSVVLGKGTGIKAPDFYTAWLCRPCHDLIDGRTGRWSHDECEAEWTRAYLKTVAIWFNEGIVVVK